MSQNISRNSNHKDRTYRIRQRIVCLCAVVVFSFCLAQVAQASSEMDVLLKLLIKKGVITEQEAEEMRAEVKKEVVEKPQPVTVMSTQPVKEIKFGGKLEIRYEDSGGEEGTLKMNEFQPYVKVDVNDNMSMKGQLVCYTDSVTVNEAWMQYKGLPVVEGDAKAGKFRRESFGLPQGSRARVSVDYSLLGRAFTGERQVGVEYTRSVKEIGLLGPVKFGIGVFNGGDIGNREAGDNDKSPVRFVADRAGDIDDNQSKEFSFRTTVEPVKGLQMGSSVLVGKLISADIFSLNTNLSTSYTNDKKQRFGGDLTYKFSNVPLELRGEYMYGKTSELEMDSWYTMGLLRDIKGKFDLYGRYGQLKPDIAVTSGSYTWDLEQTTLGGIWHFNKTTQFQVEYEFNEEEPSAGTNEVDNDILRVEWQTEF